MVFLPELGASQAAIIDAQKATSVPKKLLLGKKLLARHIDADASVAAIDLAQNLGRIYSRFAFPDEVVAVLAKMKSKARRGAAGSGAFGRVLDHVDLRVRANHSGAPGRVLYLYVIVSAHLLIPRDEVESDGPLVTTSVVGLKSQEQIGSASLTRLSELLANTCESYLSDRASTDGTTLLKLWELWTERFKQDLLDSQLNDEVTEFRIELMSEEEISLASWRRTVSLDLEDLSDPALASD